MWKKISSKKIFDHPRLSLIEDEVQLPNGNKTKYLWIDDKGDAVSIICKRKDGKILLQKEYSYPPNKVMFQLPGGLVPKCENIKKGANRELMEESKIKANNLKLLGSYYIDNRRKKSKMYVFLGTNLEEKHLNHDPEEIIENFWLTEKEIDEMIKQNKLENVHLLASWSLYKSQKLQ